MSDEFIPDSDLDAQDDDLEAMADDSASDGEYEEISSDEVDNIVEKLESLIDTVDSENIKNILEEAAASIYSLVYDEEDDDLADAA